MGLIIRLGAYMISALTIWQFAQSGDATILPAKHLTLDSNNAMVLGVCAGLSNYTGFDATIIRLFWILSCLYRGLGIGLYIVAFLIMPTAG